MTESTIVMTGQARQARQPLGSLPEPSEKPQFRCEAGVRTKKVTEDLAQRGLHGLSRTFCSHFNRLLFLPVWPETSLPGTYRDQTLAPYVLGKQQQLYILVWKLFTSGGWIKPGPSTLFNSSKLLLLGLSKCVSQ